MIALVKTPRTDGYWSGPETAETPRDEAAASPAREQAAGSAGRRPYDWSNIVFAVDYCRETRREYEAAKAG